MISSKSALLPFSSSAIECLPACAQHGDQLRINQIQVIGTHNSYHAACAQHGEVMAGKESAGIQRPGLHTSRLPSNSTAAFARSNSMSSLTARAAGTHIRPARRGCRVNYRPIRLRFRRRNGQAGFKVMHMQDVDYAAPANLS